MEASRTLPGLKADGFEDGKLPDVLEEAEKWVIRRSDSLYRVLFATRTTRRSSGRIPWPKGMTITLSRPWARTGFPEKALFEEYILFGKGHMHDLADVRRLLPRRRARTQVAGGRNRQGKPSGASMRNTIPM